MVARELRRAVGGDLVVDPVPGEYLVNATEARGVAGLADALALPHTQAEVAAVVAWCYEHDVVGCINSVSCCSRFVFVDQSAQQVASLNHHRWPPRIPSRRMPRGRVRRLQVQRAVWPLLVVMTDVDAKGEGAGN